jgi:hypothetical protein
VTKVQVNWTPKVGFLVKTRYTDTFSVGNDVAVTIPYSVSYTNESNVVIWAPAPVAQPGSYTASLGQDLTMGFRSATQNGVFTQEGLTLGAVTVPANSVYWDLGTVRAGSAGELTARFSTRNGWENQVVFATTVTIDSGRGVSATSPVVLTASSKPAPAITKSASNLIMVDGAGHVYPGPPYNAQVNYAIVFRNGSSAGVEEMFDPSISDDLTAIIDLLASPACGSQSPSQIAELITSPDQGFALDVDAKRATWPVGNLPPGDQASVSLSVSFASCRWLASDYPPGTFPTVANTATGSSAKSAPVRSTARVIVGGVPDSRAVFATGNAVDGCRAINAGSDDCGITTYGATEDVLFSASNSGLLGLYDIVMQAALPPGYTFVSASLPATVGGGAYYYPGDDYPWTGDTSEQAPPFDVNDPASGGWSATPPANPAAVTWVTFSIECLSSKTGVPGASGGCTAPATVTTSMTMRAPTADTSPPGPDCPYCHQIDSVVTAHYAAYSRVADIGSPEVTTSPEPLVSLLDREPVHAGPALPALSMTPTQPTPSLVSPGEIFRPVSAVLNAGQGPT